MNVSELYDLTYWVAGEIEDKQILQKYQALQKVFQTLSQPNQQKQPFETQKESLIDALNEVPLGKLSRDQIEFLEQLKISPHVGKEGIKSLEDILFRNSLDVATAAKRLKEIIQQISQGIGKSNQIQTGLDDCVFEEEYESHNEILMRVSFTGHAQMGNVKEFKNWGSTWYDIGRGIAMAHGSSPEDIKIVGATKGSVVLELAVIASIATTTSGIILAALKVAEKVMDIRLKAEDLRGMKLRNDQLAIELEEEAEKEKKAGISDITDQIVETLGINSNSEGDKVKALDTSVKNLVNFIEKGGVVDFIAPDIEEDDESTEVNSELRVAFQEIRRLEKKLEMIEYK